MYHSFQTGKVWLDTDGKRIQAHGGSVLFINGTFYWYGENKEKTTGEDETWHWGVRCYSSKDLYNWKDEGIIIPPDLEDKTSPLYPSSMMDRPHILYNKKTEKYVAWLKIMGEPSYFTVLEADDILGPYKMVNKKVNPFGNLVGDFDLISDEKSCKAYVISQKPHSCIYCAELNDAYTDAKGEYSEHFYHTAPPEAREAPACFMREGKCFIITSGTTGYYPNPSEAAVADTWHGPYTILGNPHVNDSSDTSFNSQISSVFKHPYKKDLYIAVADRWRPDVEAIAGEKFLTGEFEKQIQEKFRNIFDESKEYVFTEEDAKDMRINSSVSDYVWLPIRFDGDKVLIDWKDEWTIEEYE